MSEFIFRRRHGRIIASSKISGLSEDDQRQLCELDFETSVVLLPPGCYLNHSRDRNAMRHGVVVFAGDPSIAMRKSRSTTGSTCLTMTRAGTAPAGAATARGR